MAEQQYDYDWLVIGSGFGGSVSALRLSEKGYQVGVLECGRRFEDEDFAKSSWNLRKFVWVPHFGLRGIMRIYIFKDVAILAGCGVGGGSLVYANTLYVPPKEFFQADEWRHLEDWEAVLAPHYTTAKRMLGAVDVPFENDADRFFQELAREMGVEYKRPTVGVFFGEPGETVPDPFFGGEGPDRAGCIKCGQCMVGCRHNAKNTLRKNYLHLAERNGVEIWSQRNAVDIKPLGAGDGSDGYEVTTQFPGAWLRRRRKSFTARGVVISAGAVGTNWLLANCKRAGSLPELSDRLGERVRTNSEALLAVTARKKGQYDFAEGVAISSSIYPDKDTHIENVTYGKAGDAMGLLFTMLTEGGTRVTRPLKWLRNVILNPIRALRLLRKRGWSERTIILLVMQTLNNSLKLKHIPIGRKKVLLQTEQDPDNPNPTWIPVANQAAEILAEKIDGTAQSNLPEALLNMPATAHILGGVVIGESPDEGVIDRHQRVFGYENLLVCDGSVVPANPGVNPSLTITALAENAMSHVPIRAAAAARRANGAREPMAEHSAGEPVEPIA
jgi:cholesterol oxidase